MATLVESASTKFTIVFLSVAAVIFIALTLSLSLTTSDPLKVKYMDVWGCPRLDATTYDPVTCQGQSLLGLDNSLSLFIGPFVATNGFLSVGLSFYAGQDSGESSSCPSLSFDVTAHVTAFTAPKGTTCIASDPSDITLGNTNCYTEKEEEEPNPEASTRTITTTQCIAGSYPSTGIASIETKEGEYYQIRVTLNKISQEEETTEYTHAHPFLSWSFPTHTIQERATTIKIALFYVCLAVHILLSILVALARAHNLRGSLEFSIFWLLALLLPLLQLPIMAAASPLSPLSVHMLQILPAAVFGAVHIVLVLLLLKTAQHAFEALVTSQALAGVPGVSSPSTSRYVCGHRCTLSCRDKRGKERGDLVKRLLMGLATFLAIQFSVCCFSAMALPSGSMRMTPIQGISFLFLVLFLVLTFVWLAHNGLGLLACWVCARKIVGTLPHQMVWAGGAGGGWGEGEGDMDMNVDGDRDGGTGRRGDGRGTGRNDVILYNRACANELSFSSDDAMSSGFSVYSSSSCSDNSSDDIGDGKHSHGREGRGFGYGWRRGQRAAVGHIERPTASDNSREEEEEEDNSGYSDCDSGISRRGTRAGGEANDVGALTNPSREELTLQQTHSQSHTKPLTPSMPQGSSACGMDIATKLSRTELQRLGATAGQRQSQRQKERERDRMLLKQPQSADGLETPESPKSQEHLDSTTHDHGRAGGKRSRAEDKTKDPLKHKPKHKPRRWGWRRALGLEVGPLFGTVSSSILAAYVFLVVFSIVFLVACGVGAFSDFAIAAGLTRLGYMGIFSALLLVLTMGLLLAPVRLEALETLGVVPKR